MPMQLAEAIRAGCEMRPQGFGRYAAPGEDGTIGTCAVGAAIEGAGIGRVYLDQHSGMAYNDFYKVWPVLRERIQAHQITCGCPRACFDEDWNIESTIYHLNDSHQWTREMIAEWLDQYVEAPARPVAKTTITVSQICEVTHASH